jgi:hypothetical protein
MKTKLKMKPFRFKQKNSKHGIVIEAYTKEEAEKQFDKHLGKIENDKV